MDENEKQKQKIQQKDVSMQNNLNKTIQLQSSIDKLSLENKNLKKEISVRSILDIKVEIYLKGLNF